LTIDQKTILSCPKGVSKIRKFRSFLGKLGDRFRLKAGNGEVIAIGEGYKTKEGCLNGIESIKKNAPEARIEEVEE